MRYEDNESGMSLKANKRREDNDDRPHSGLYHIPSIIDDRPRQSVDTTLEWSYRDRFVRTVLYFTNVPNHIQFSQATVVRLDILTNPFVVAGVIYFTACG